MAQVQNLTIEQGIPFTQDFIVKDENNVNVDLTGYSARMHFRLNYNDSTIRLDANTTNGKLVIDTVNSKCSIALSEADTASLVFQKYVYDIELVNPSNVPKRMVQGSVTIDLEVTK